MTGRRDDRPARQVAVRRRASGDRGQAVLLALVVVVVIGLVLTSALAGVGRVAIDRQRARTAADAAALAGLTGGRPAAAALAARHGAELVEWRELRDTDEVLVAVDRGGVIARARATDAP